MSNTDGLAQCCQNFFVKMREKREGSRTFGLNVFLLAVSRLYLKHGSVLRRVYYSGRKGKASEASLPSYSDFYPQMALRSAARTFLSKCGRKGKASEASLPSYSDFYAQTSKSAWRKASEASLPSYYALLNLQPFVTIVSC